MKHRATLPLTLLLACASLTDGLFGRVVKIEPGEDYRPALDALKPGDELVFLPGLHEQHAEFNVSGTASAPIVIRGETGPDGRRAEIRWTERGHNTWRVSGEHLQIRNLAFHSAQHYGMRVGEGADITIENCLFRNNGGGDLSANSGKVVSLHVLRSRFIGGQRTPVYIGTHNGSQVVEDFRFEGNVVDGSQIDHGGVIGYGIQLKLNVDGAIRNNYISGSQGPGIMVYGFDDPSTDHHQVVEGNIVVAARNSANIVVGGGPVTVRGNLVLGGHRGGIAVIDYGGRNLLESITVKDNIAAANERHGLHTSPNVRNLIGTGNCVFKAPGEPGIGGLPRSGDVDGNEAAPIEPQLLEVVERLRGRVPSSEAASEALEACKKTSLTTQEALIRVLRPLLEQ